MSGLAEKPLVSVLVPTYQHVSFIEECLDSILAQRTDFPVELIIGEDGSTDGTREICKAYAAKFPDLIRLFLNDRKDVILLDGRISGRANVLKLYPAARGNYIAVCEGDDKWTDPDKLSLQVAELEANPEASGCFHGTVMIDEQGRSTGGNFRNVVPARMNMEDVVSGWSPFHLSSVMFRNGAFYRNPPRWVRTVGSFDLLIFAVQAAQGPWVGMPHTMSAYRKHSGGYTRHSVTFVASFNYLRILVWLHLDSHFRGRWSDRMWCVMEEHYGRLIKAASGRVRLRYFLRIIAQRPGQALTHLSRYFRWGRMALRGR